MTWPIAKEAITNFLCGSATNFPTTLSIADMGCSSGPNSLFFVSNLIQQVEHIRKEFHKPPLEYQVLLNDLHGNDFNAIFTSLPSLLESLKAQVGGCLGPCFFSGVPGSFYGRLFPTKSLHFVYSSYSLHWLSQVTSKPPNSVCIFQPLSFCVHTACQIQVPKGIESNKGNAFIGSSTPKTVLEAYYTQFHKDFSVFLKCRAEEMVCGGRMVLTIIGRTNEDPCSEDYCYVWGFLSSALNHMAAEVLYYYIIVLQQITHLYIIIIFSIITQFLFVSFICF